jgi:hypothetical protein
MITDIIKKLINKRREKKKIARLINRVNSRLKNFSNSQYAITDTEKRLLNAYYRRWNIKLTTFNFHDFHKRVTHNFDVRLIPEDIYFYKIDQYFNNWPMARFIDNKTLYPILFKNVRLPEDICYRQNGYWYNNKRQLINFEIVQGILSKEPHVFIKIAQESYGGHGVKYLSSSVAAEYSKTIASDIVIQKPIEQSPVLSAINPSSVNTIRILTFLRKDGSVKICSMILRMGIGDSKVDNASSGGITVGIQESGNLKRKAYSVDGMCYDLHPTTGIEFDKIKIPNISLIKDLVLNQAPNFPHFRLISWDIALDKDNCPILIEANLCDGELDFHQLNNGPVFGDETEEILSEVFSR